jgi:two-component system, response regulator
MVAQAIEILLVEDNPDDLELGLHALRKDNLANQIRVARDGAEALDFLHGLPNGHQPRLVLLDLKLPKLDGLEVLRRMRSDDRTRMVPVVIMTSSNEERDLIESYRLGVNSYIQKPVDFSKFTDIVRQVGLYWLVINRIPDALDGNRP